jgi:hypothetical protein
MELNEARTIVGTLAQGIDPTTGEVFAQDSPYNHPDVIRALFTLSELGGRARPPRLSLDERRQRNLDQGRPRNSGLPWSDDDRVQVAAGFRDGSTIQELATRFERSRSAIVAEVLRQDLVPQQLR